MIELVEATVLAEQLNKTIRGKRIKNVVAAQSPHKFAWFFGDPQAYNSLLSGKIIGESVGYGGQLEIKAEDTVILFNDGVSIKYHDQIEEVPKKHQLLIEFDDSSAISASVQMYGGLSCFHDGANENPYYLVAKEKPSPLSDNFDKEYFNHIFSTPEMDKLSAKAFLATEQRIPGLGNGVLQDILFYAGIHPKRKIKTFTEEEKNKLFKVIKSTLSTMIKQGGRDTEKDLFGNYGGYQTVVSKNTVDKPCPVCGTLIQKEAYLGGSVYYCSECQRKPE